MVDVVTRSLQIFARVRFVFGFFTEFSVVNAITWQESMFEAKLDVREPPITVLKTEINIGIKL